MDKDTEKTENLKQHFGFESIKVKIENYGSKEGFLEKKHEELKQNNTDPLCIPDMLSAAIDEAKDSFLFFLVRTMEEVKTLLSQPFPAPQIEQKSFKYYQLYRMNLGDESDPYTEDFWNECLNEAIDNYKKTKNQFESWVNRIAQRAQNQLGHAPEAEGSDHIFLGKREIEDQRGSAHEEDESAKAPTIAQFCRIVNAIDIIAKPSDMIIETYCRMVCNTFNLPYTDNVRKNFSQRDSDKLKKKVSDQILPHLVKDEKRNKIESYIYGNSTVIS